MQVIESSAELEVALVGTTGESSWREDFYSALFYGAFPDEDVFVVDGRAGKYPAPADQEGYALAIEQDLYSADVVVVAITGETYGTEELEVLGFALAAVVGTDRPMLVYVAQELDEALTDPVAREQSERARRLAVAYFRQLRLVNVELTDSLDELLAACSRTLEKLNARA